MFILNKHNTCHHSSFRFRYYLIRLCSKTFKLQCQIMACFGQAVRFLSAIYTYLNNLWIFTVQARIRLLLSSVIRQKKIPQVLSYNAPRRKYERGKNRSDGNVQLEENRYSTSRFGILLDGTLIRLLHFFKDDRRSFFKFDSETNPDT